MNAPPRYAVAVRALCDFTARQGDLDTRFTPSPSAAEGVAGHAVVASRRGPGYRREVTLRGSFATLDVRGRADGYDPLRKRLEEFKTHRGDLARMPANHRCLHWAQLKIYGALWCRQEGVAEVELALVYFELTRGAETVLTGRFPATALERHFEEHCRRFLDWASAETAHRLRRDRFLDALPFPHPALRPGQRHLAESVYRAAVRGRDLMAQAPTGIGKTLGTVFPLLKAAPKRALDKLFFLVAKTSGRGIVLGAMQRLGVGLAEVPLRVLEFVSRDAACEHPGAACNADACPLARGFYDRLPLARAAALGHGMLDQPRVREVALQFSICPYHLGHELARWCDLVVGDYNYYFDASAALAALTVANEWRVGVLVDEAHNLLPRARQMYSAALGREALRAAQSEAPAPMALPLARFAAAWEPLWRAQRTAYQCHPAIPDELRLAVQRFLAAAAEQLAADATPFSAGLQRCHFDALHFMRMADSFGEHSLFDVTRDGTDIVLCVRNVIPAPFLAPRFAAASSSVLFSATLAPAHYYRRLLGLPEETGWIDVATPFSADQLAVRVARGISTRYRDRAASIAPIVALMARQFDARPGNYLAFFSSFDYLQRVLAQFRERHPAIEAWEQQRRMVAAERERFLDRFTPQSRGIGFAVLGGVFGEGIDLPGERLVGAFIATLGLPQINPVNTEFERRMQDLFGAGFEYTYLYPGLQKVAQAAGRVIRTPTDRGTLHLIDDRFLRGDVRALLPPWWGLSSLRTGR